MGRAACEIGIGFKRTVLIAHLLARQRQIEISNRVAFAQIERFFKKLGCFRRHTILCGIDEGLALRDQSLRRITQNAARIAEGACRFFITAKLHIDGADNVPAAPIIGVGYKMLFNLGNGRHEFSIALAFFDARLQRQVRRIRITKEGIKRERKCRNSNQRKHRRRANSHA